MAARKSRSSSPLGWRSCKRKIRTIAEEIGDGDDAKSPLMTPPSALTRTFALSCIASLIPSHLRSPQSQSQSQSPSPTRTQAKLGDYEDSGSQPNVLAAKLSKCNHPGGHLRKPPPSPPRFSEPQGLSASRQEEASQRLQKPLSIAGNEPQLDSNTSADPSRKEHSSSPVLPKALNGGQGHSVPSPSSHPPASYHSDREASKDRRLSKRKSWLGLSSRSRNTSQDISHSQLPAAWVEIDGRKQDYNFSLLLNGHIVPELWGGENADTFVYLFPDEPGTQAQFRIHSRSIASSLLLYGLSIKTSSSISSRRRSRSFDGRRILAIEDAMLNFNFNASNAPSQACNFPYENQSTLDESYESIETANEGVRNYELPFPTNLSSNGQEISARDFRRLIDVRNLFALLEGQALVRTRENPTPFRVFTSIASLLQELQFTNIDGSTYGEAAATAFGFCSRMERLADVSQSREKTIEGIILGERMRSLELYNEAFAHAVGKYEAINRVNPSLYSQISPNTRKRLDRAFLDLGQRQRGAELRLSEFEFPSLFAGIAASTSSEESKFIRFKAWKSNFQALRKTVLCFYKDVHGQWPPKANSKKNNFVEGGLNRLVLRGLYNDLCGLYELLVDREAITTRGIDPSEDKDATNVNPTAAVLRRLLAEFDRSSPPVTPPIPFDVPLIPSIATLNPNYLGLGPKEQNKLANKKLKDHENQLIVAKSHNNLTNDYEHGPRMIFLDMFRDLEAKEARGKTCSQLEDMRCGYWLFIYAVLQSLPMLVVDAPGLRYTEGVEYFLCEPSMGNPPWMEDAAVKREWYGVANSGNTVILPSDLVNHGVEGIYRRSFCWMKAAQWINRFNAGPTNRKRLEIDQATALSPLQPPRGLGIADFGVQQFSGAKDELRDSISSDGSLASESRGRSRQSHRRSIALGLEKLALPITPGTSPSLAATGFRGQSPAGIKMCDRDGRRVSSSDPFGKSMGDEYKGSTFDDILGNMAPEKPKEAGRGKGVMGRFK